MGRLLGVLVGALVGLAGAGIAAAVLIPLVAPPWRSEALVWTIAAIVVTVCMAAGLLVTRPARR